MRRSVLLVMAAVGVAVLLSGSEGAEAGGGCHGDVEARFSDEATTSVAASQCAFYPTVARVEAGETITFHNKDEALHTFTGVLGSWGDFQEYREGESVSHTFNEPGVYPYFCEFHPGMAGAIVVGDGTAASSGAGLKAVSAVFGGEAEDPETEGALTEEEVGGGAAAEVIAAVAVVGAVLGGVALTPFALRRLRSGM